MIAEPVLDVMSVKAAEELLREGSVKGLDRTALVSVIRRALAEEMDVERKISDEADKLITANMGAVKGAKADLGDLRRKIMNKLASERGLVLR